MRLDWSPREGKVVVRMEWGDLWFSLGYFLASFFVQVSSHLGNEGMVWIISELLPACFFLGPWIRCPVWWSSKTVPIASDTCLNREEKIESDF